MYGAQAPTNRIRNKTSADQDRDRSPEALREVRCIVKWTEPSIAWPFCDGHYRQTNHGEAPSARRLEHIEQRLEEISGLLR